MNRVNQTYGGSLRKLRTGALVSVLAVGTAIALGNTVSADEVTATDAQVPATETLVTQSSEMTVQPVTETQVTESHAQATEAGSQAVAQESVVTNEQANVEAQTQAVSNIQAQIVEVSSVTQETVSQAESSLNQANQLHQDAEKAVESANATVNLAKDSVEKNTETVKLSEELANQANSEYVSAQEKVSNLANETSISDLKEKVESEEKAVQSATETVANTEKALNAAKESETNKNEALKQAQDALTQASKTLSDTQENLNNSELNLSAAKNAEEGADSKLLQAQAGTKTTTQVQVGTETTVKNAAAKVKPGIVSLKFADNGEAVYFNDSYLKAIKALADGTGSVEDVRAAVTEGVDNIPLAGQGYYRTVAFANYESDKKNSAYKELQVNDGDSAEYEVFRLPDEKLTDLALFYTALVNEMRSRVGVQDYLVVTQESMDSIKKTLNSAFTSFTTRYLNGEFHTAGKIREEVLGNPNEYKGTTNSFKYGWDFKELQKQDSDTFTTTVSSMHSYDKFGDALKMTMSQLKSHIAHVVGRQLYTPLIGSTGNYNGKESKNFEAAMAILGLDGKGYNALGLDIMPGATEGVGGAIDAFPTFFTRMMKSDSPAIENPYMEFIGGEKTTTPIYETKETVVVDEKAVKVAEKELANAKEGVLKAQNAYNNAKSSYDIAREGFEVARNNLNDIKADNVDIPALESALAESKNVLAEAEGRLNGAKEALKLASASQETKIKALENAKFELAQAEDKKEKAEAQLVVDRDNLELASNGLKIAEAHLAQSQENLKAAQVKQAEAQAEYDDVSAKFAKREMSLTELSSKLKDAQKELELAKTKEKAESAKLEELKNKASRLWAEYLELKARYDSQSGDKTSQEIADKAKEIVESGDKVIPIVDETGSVVDVVAESKTSVTENGKVLVDGKEHDLLEDGTLRKSEEDKVQEEGKEPLKQDGQSSSNNGVSIPVTVGDKYLKQSSVASKFGQETAKMVVNSSKASEEVKSLPNTGTVSGVALSVIGAMSGALGLAGVRRKED